jgi:hypothetical protein
MFRALMAACCSSLRLPKLRRLPRKTSEATARQTHHSYKTPTTSHEHPQAHSTIPFPDVTPRSVCQPRQKTAPLSHSPLINPPNHPSPMDQLRAVRPLPGTRRNLFHQGTRRQNPTSVRPDTANIFQQPMDEELVERTPTGEYALYAPQTTYKHMALGLGGGQEVDEEIGIYIHFRKGGQARANACDRAREAND